MAEGHVKQALEKEVTCPLCLDILQEPKKLPCDHVYCGGCLETLVNRSFDASISCPECRTVTQVPDRTVSNLPTAFRLNRLIEVFQQVEVKEEIDVAKTVEESEAVEEAKCKIHENERLVLYCENCQTLICRDCVLATRNHADHHYGFINEMKEKLQDKLMNVASVLENQNKNLSKTIDEMAQVESTLAVCERQCQEEIEQGFGALYRMLQKSERAMKEMAVQRLKLAGVPFVGKKQQLLSIQSKVTTVIDQAKNSLDESEADFLTKHSSNQQQLETLQQALNKTSLSLPQRPQFIAPKVMAAESLEQELEKYNGLCSFDPTKWQVSGGFLNGGEVGKKYTLVIESSISGKFRRAGTVGQKRSSKFEVELFRTRDKSITLREILEHSQDRITVNIKPQTRGRHELRIKINGMHIPNSPFAVFINMPPKRLSIPITEISGMQRPTGLWYTEGKILASEWGGNRVTKSPAPTLDDLNTFVELKGVTALTSDPQSGAIFATTDKNQVHKFTQSGELIKKVGDRGKLCGQFDLPKGLRVSQQDELYICDSYNNRIQILDFDLNFRRLFGTTGTNKGQFSFPSDVEFDTSGNIYIADHMNHRIQAFTPSEQFLFMVGDHCNKPFNNPVSLAIHKDLLYITEMRGHRVSVMTTSGELVGRFGDGHLQIPEGIAIDEDGYVYVTSHCSKVLTF